MPCYIWHPDLHLGISVVLPLPLSIYPLKVTKVYFLFRMGIRLGDPSREEDITTFQTESNPAYIRLNAVRYTTLVGSSFCWTLIKYFFLNSMMMMINNDEILLPWQIVIRNFKILQGDITPLNFNTSYNNVQHVRLIVESGWAKMGGNSISETNCW